MGISPCNTMHLGNSILLALLLAFGVVVGETQLERPLPAKNVERQEQSERMDSTFPMVFTGHFRHVAFGRQSNQILVEIYSPTSGRWYVEEESEDIAINYDGDRMSLSDLGGITVMKGKVLADGTIKGKVVQKGEKGGTFKLIPALPMSKKKAEKKLASKTEQVPDQKSDSQGEQVPNSGGGKKSKQSADASVYEACAVAIAFVVMCAMWAKLRAHRKSLLASRKQFVGTLAFNDEVAAYAHKNSIKGAAKHFGLSREEVRGRLEKEEEDRQGRRPSQRALSALSRVAAAISFTLEVCFAVVDRMLMPYRFVVSTACRLRDLWRRLFVERVKKVAQPDEGLREAPIPCSKAVDVNGEYVIVIRRAVGRAPGGRSTLGIAVDSTDGATLLLEGLADGGLIQEWNRSGQGVVVKPGDRIVEVNEVRGDAKGLLRECNKIHTLRLTLKREQAVKEIAKEGPQSRLADPRFQAAAAVFLVSLRAAANLGTDDASNSNKAGDPSVAAPRETMLISIGAAAVSAALAWVFVYRGPCARIDQLWVAFQSSCLRKLEGEKKQPEALDVRQRVVAYVQANSIQLAMTEFDLSREEVETMLEAELAQLMQAVEKPAPASKHRLAAALQTAKTQPRKNKVPPATRAQPQPAVPEPVREENPEEISSSHCASSAANGDDDFATSEKDASTQCDGSCVDGIEDDATSTDMSVSAEEVKIFDPVKEEIEESIYEIERERPIQEEQQEEHVAEFGEKEVAHPAGEPEGAPEGTAAECAREARSSPTDPEIAALVQEYEDAANMWREILRLQKKLRQIDDIERRMQTAECTLDKLQVEKVKRKPQIKATLEHVQKRLSSLSNRKVHGTLEWAEYLWPRIDPSTEATSSEKHAFAASVSRAAASPVDFQSGDLYMSALAELCPEFQQTEFQQPVGGYNAGAVAYTLPTGYTWNASVGCTMVASDTLECSAQATNQSSPIVSTHGNGHYVYDAEDHAWKPCPIQPTGCHLQYL